MLIFKMNDTNFMQLQQMFFRPLAFFLCYTTVPVSSLAGDFVSKKCWPWRVSCDHSDSAPSQSHIRLHIVPAPNIDILRGRGSILRLPFDAL